MMKQKVVDPQVNSLLSTIIERCRKEAERKSLQVPLDEYVERASYYTAFPKMYIYEIEQQNLNLNKGASQGLNFDVIELIAILKALYELYSIKSFPKLNQLFHKVKDVIKCEDFFRFKQEIFSMNFDYRPTKISKLLSEDPKCSFERFYYLKTIKKHRSNNSNICYIDERIVDDSNLFTKPDNNDKTLSKSFIIFHMFNNSSIKNYLFTNHVNIDIFTKWITEVLLCDLKPNSVIIMDNSPLHCKLQERSITRYHSKNDMIQWLRRNDIPHSSDMHKAELFELINKFMVKEVDYSVDRLLKAHGHEVLRLPQNCQNLSPTNLLWKKISKNLMDKNFVMTKENDLIEAIHLMHHKEWADIEKKVINWEDELYDLSIKIEDAIDNSYTFDIDNFDVNYSVIPEYFYVFDEV